MFVICHNLGHDMIMIMIMISMYSVHDDNLNVHSSHPALVHIRVPQAGLAVLLASSQHLHTKHDGHGNDNSGDQLK